MVIAQGDQWQWPKIRKEGLCPHRCWNPVVYATEFGFVFFFFFFSMNCRELPADLRPGNNITDFYFRKVSRIIL